jgi:hypothetical protein
MLMSMCIALCLVATLLGCHSAWLPLCLVATLLGCHSAWLPLCLISSAALLWRPFGCGGVCCPVMASIWLRWRLLPNDQNYLGALLACMHACVTKAEIAQSDVCWSEFLWRAGMFGVVGAWVAHHRWARAPTRLERFRCWYHLAPPKAKTHQARCSLEVALTVTFFGKRGPLRQGTLHWRTSFQRVLGMGPIRMITLGATSQLEL